MLAGFGTQFNAFNSLQIVYLVTLWSYCKKTIWRKQRVVELIFKLATHVLVHFLHALTAAITTKTTDGGKIFALHRP